MAGEQPDDPTAGLEDYPQHFLLRRVSKHRLPPEETWNWKRLRTARGRIVEYRHATMCERCKWIVVDHMDAATGERKRVVRYPEGYLLRGRRMTAPVARLLLVRRLAAGVTPGLPGTVEDEVLSDEELRAAGYAPD